MSDFDMRSMLVEVRLMKAGKLGASKNKAPEKKPTSFGNEFERLIWEKPAFKALYEDMKKRRMQNETNLCIELRWRRTAVRQPKLTNYLSLFDEFLPKTSDENSKHVKLVRKKNITL